MSQFELVEDPDMYPYIVFKIKDHAGIDIPNKCEGPVVAAAEPKKKRLGLLRSIYRGYMKCMVFLMTIILSVVSLVAPYVGIAIVLILILNNQPSSPAMANITHESEQTNCRGLINWALDDNMVAITKAVLDNMEGPLIGGTFLEVGQFEDGKSVTVALEIGLLWKGVLMGPNPWAMDDLNGRPDRTALRIHGCISTGKTHDLMPLTLDADRQIVHNRAVTNGGQLTRVFVPCFPLMEVLKRAEGYQKLDLLYLDTEVAAEPLDKIVESLEFDAIFIQVIAIVEPKTANQRAKNATERAYDILNTHGYDMAKKIGDTVIFAKMLPSKQ